MPRIKTDLGLFVLEHPRRGWRVCSPVLYYPHFVACRSSSLRSFLPYDMIVLPFRGDVRAGADGGW